MLIDLKKNRFNEIDFEEGLNKLFTNNNLVNNNTVYDSLQLDDDYFLNEYFKIDTAERNLYRTKLYILKNNQSLLARCRNFIKFYHSTNSEKDLKDILRLIVFTIFVR